MKSIKLSVLFLAPGLAAVNVGSFLYSFAGNTPDVLHLFHATCGRQLLPFISFVSVALVFIPALFFMARLLFSIDQLPAPDMSANIELLTYPAPVSVVGQTFTSAGANCYFRVKSVKASAIFSELEKSNELLYDYL